MTDTLQSIKQDLQFMKFAGGGGSNENSTGGDGGDPGNGGGSGNTSAGGAGGMTLEQLKLLSGGGGMGMSQQERNNLRRCQDELEDFNRRFTDMEEKMKHLESKNPPNLSNSNFF